MNIFLSTVNSLQDNNNTPKRDSDELEYLFKLRQNMSLGLKVDFTVNRIKWFMNNINKYPVISFSGGADSLALLHIARKYINPEFPAVFQDTGVEFPEIRKFAMSFNNVTKHKALLWLLNKQLLILSVVFTASQPSFIITNKIKSFTYM